MTDRWTAQQCAEHWRIGKTTWTSYVGRGQAPPAVGFDPDTGLRVWDAEQVQARKPGAKWDTAEREA